MSDEPKSHTQATPLAPVFLDDDTTPLPVPRAAMRYQLSEPGDMQSWATSDAGTAITEASKP